MTWKGEFDWYGAPAIPDERVMYTNTPTKRGATAFFKARIAKHLMVTIRKVNYYYREHETAYNVKEVV